MNGLRMKSGKKSKSFWKQMKMSTQRPKLWDSSNTVPRGKFTAIQAYIKEIETFQTNNLTLCLQELEEQQQRKPRARGRKEITKISAELNLSLIHI